jgi:hypothetical protein
MILNKAKVALEIVSTMRRYRDASCLLREESGGASAHSPGIMGRREG